MSQVRITCIYCTAWRSAVVFLAVLRQRPKCAFLGTDSVLQVLVERRECSARFVGIHRFKKPVSEIDDILQRTGGFSLQFFAFRTVLHRLRVPCVPSLAAVSGDMFVQPGAGRFVGKPGMFSQLLCTLETLFRILLQRG
jgi:hypothetical protein